MTVLFEFTADADVSLRMFSSERVGNDMVGEKLDAFLGDSPTASSSGMVGAMVCLGRRRDLFASSVTFDWVEGARCCCLGEVVFDDSPRSLDGDLRLGDLRGGDLRLGEFRVARREAISSDGVARVVLRFSMFKPNLEDPANVRATEQTN